MARADHLGGKLAPKLASIVADAMTHHLARSGDHRARIGAEAANQFFGQINREFRDHLSPLLAEYHTDIPDDHPAKPLMRFLVTQPGEGSALMALQAAGSALGTGLGSGVSAILAPANQRILQTLVPFPLPATTAAALAAQGLVSVGSAATEAARSGLDGDRFGHLLGAAYNYGDLALLLELYRRRELDGGELATLLHRLGYAPEIGSRLPALSRVILEPAVAADLVLKGWISEEEGRAIGEHNGLSHGDFDLLVKDTGEPPATEQLLFAYRRNIIDRSRLEHGIRQSRVRDEWIDVLEKLRFAPMATADAIDAVVRNFLSEEEGKRIAEENGLQPDHWTPLLEAHGRPPGPMQAIELWRRGNLTEAQVEQAIRESDVKNKYIPYLKHLRYRIPAERLILTLVQHGTMAPKRATQLLEEDGYEPDVARSIVSGGASQRVAGHKQLALSQVLELYHDHAITEAKARELIVALGYPPEDVPLLLSIQDLRRERHYRDQAVEATRAAYLHRRIDASEAHAELGAEGVAGAEADHLLALWGVALRGQRKVLSEAHITKAHRERVFDTPTAISRLEQLGYTASDARVIIETERPVPRGA